MLLQDGVHAPSSAKAKIMLLPVVLFINRCILLKKMPTYLRKTHSLRKLTLGIVIP